MTSMIHYGQSTGELLKTKKTRVQWLNFGDQTTGSFFKKFKQRKNTNKILKIESATHIITKVPTNELQLFFMSANYL